MKRKKLLWIAPLAILGILLFAWLGGQIVRLLWNALLPQLFGWRQITFWQALGILVLCRILFGGFRLQDSSRSRMRRRMEERMALMQALTPEEREKFRQRMGGRCGFDPSPSENKGQ